MKKQKVLSLILAAALCVSTPASAMAAEFSSGSENDAVQVTTEAATEETFTDSTDVVEEITENADVTEFVPEVNDEDAALNAEAGNDIDNATSISLNTEYTGALSDDNDADFYKVTLNEAGVFNIRGFYKIPHVMWRIYDDIGNCIYEDHFYIDRTSKRGTIDRYWSLTRGTYFISINSREKGVGEYAFSLGLKSANETIPEEQGGSNNVSDDADEISLNKTYKGQIAFNDRSDWYKFTIPKTEKIKIIGKSADQKNWRIYKETDEIIQPIARYNSYSGSPYITEELQMEPGTYYLNISAGFSGYVYEDYQFKLQTHTHSWKNEITKATLTENGTIIPKCACGETGSIKTIYCPKTIRLSKTRYKYNGYAQKPTVKVIGSDGKVISPSYYKITYSKGLTAKGTYTVKITFKGRYSGSVKKYFKIV